MWHSTGLPRCLRWCGIRAGLPLRARPGGGCIGEMMRRLAGSSQKPPPSRLLTLLHLLRRPSSSSSSFIPLALVSHPSPSLPRARARAGRGTLAPSLWLRRARGSSAAAHPLSLAPSVVDGRQGVEYNPHRRTTAAPPPHRHRRTPPNNHPDCHGRRRRVTESSRLLSHLPAQPAARVAAARRACRPYGRSIDHPLRRPTVLGSS